MKAIRTQSLMESILIEMQFVVLCSLMRILSLQNTTVLCVGGIHEAYSNSSTENQWNFSVIYAVVKCI